MIHAKKVLPDYFDALCDGRKRFELRREDPQEPSFAAGDYIALNEYDAEDEAYTGRCLLFKIVYVLRDFPGLTEGYAALGLELSPLTVSDLPELRRPQLRPV